MFSKRKLINWIKIEIVSLQIAEKWHANKLDYENLAKIKGKIGGLEEVLHILEHATACARGHGIYERALTKDG